ncbi:MAG: hypothetical protein KDA05_10245, partial [Phycisphaerales bacterium]|nr:hypothetical protein [Phycisphaerales bacterium]
MTSFRSAVGSLVFAASALLVVSLVLGARASGATAQPTRTAASARSPELLAILDEHMEWLSRRDPIS